MSRKRFEFNPHDSHSSSDSSAIAAAAAVVAAGNSIRLHDQVKPFPCPNCGRSFSRQDALSRHLKVSDNGRAACVALREGKIYSPESPKKNRSIPPHIHDMSSKFQNSLESRLFFDEEGSGLLSLGSQSHLMDRSSLILQNKNLSSRIVQLESQLLEESLQSKELENRIKQLEVEKEILRNLLQEKHSNTSSPYEKSGMSFLQKV